MYFYFTYFIVFHSILEKSGNLAKLLENSQKTLEILENHKKLINIFVNIFF